MSATAVAYIRVSTPSQDYAYQRQAIDAAARARGDRVDDWYADVATGATMDRPQLGRLWAALEAGGVRRVWVWRLDRLSRCGIRGTFEALDSIRARGVELVSVADRFSSFDRGPTSELVLAVLAGCAQMEREKIRENQEAARARLAREGRGWGRPCLPPALKDAVLALESQKFSVREIAQQLHVSKSWVHKVLRSFGR